jgi:hypothetical protein
MFPDREIIGISAIDLIWGFGTYIVCQQIPNKRVGEEQKQHEVGVLFTILCKRLFIFVNGIF